MSIENVNPGVVAGRCVSIAALLIASAAFVSLPAAAAEKPQVSISYAESSAPLLANGESPITLESGRLPFNPFLQVTALQRQAVALSTSMPPTALNFLGQGHTNSNSTITSAPPDADGAAGPNHYVQVVNGGIEIWNKSGGVVVSSRLLTTLWTGYVGTNAGNSCSSENEGYPIVLYDQLADRWFISHVSLHNYVNSSTSPNFQCVAVSKTGDPTGAYWLYDFSYNGLNDFGKFGVWPDAYYATFNMYNPSTSALIGATLCAYDRSSMLTGSTATQQCFQQSSSVFGVLPANLDGPIPPPRGSPGLFMYFLSNSLNLTQMHVDWATPANSTLSPTTISVSPFTQPCGGSNAGCIVQPSPGNTLISVSDRLMSRLTYRNFGTYESVVVNHTVSASTTSGIRWYEIRSPYSTPVVTQQGTHAPADGQWRWMGSVAQDQARGIVAGYSLSGSEKPSIAWAGRLAGDTVGTFGQTENTVQLGTGVETGTFSDGTPVNVWGFHSSMTLDPSDDCTFWYTNEINPSGSFLVWETRIATVKFPNCGANNFSISVTPASQTIPNGGHADYTVSTTSTAGSAEAIVLNVQDLPAGVIPSFSPPSVTAGSSSTLTLTATAGAPSAAAASFTVIGTAPSAVHAASAQAAVSLPAPANVVATAISANSATVTWSTVPGAATYNVLRRSAGGIFVSVGTPTASPFTDSSLTANTAYLYKVVASAAIGVSPDSNIDLATTVIYTDEPLVPGSTLVQGGPLTQMRNAVNAVQALAGQTASTFTDVPPSGALIRAVHISELRTTLDSARMLLALPALTYTHSAAAGTPVSAVDFEEIRNGMK